MTPADPALGVVEDFPFADHRATIRPGETWLLSTDGLGDTQNPAGEALEIERVLAFVSAVAGRKPGRRSISSRPPLAPLPTARRLSTT